MTRALICLLWLLVSMSWAYAKDVEVDGVSRLLHHNGLILHLHKEVGQVTLIPLGFRIHVAGTHARAVNEIEIKRLSRPDVDIDSYQKRRLDGLDYYFKLDWLSVGSGGTEHRLRIWRPLSEGGILLEHVVQQEILPVWDDAWRIIQSISQKSEQ